jgi:prepilin-type N-terminal cleavage/methylation domain-containing protein
MRCAGSRNVRHLRRDRRQSGFSLIEILVAMTVTIMGLAGLMSLYTTTAQGNSRAARTVMASTVGQQTMEELRSLPVEPPVATYEGPTLDGLVGGIPASNVALADVAQGNMIYKRKVSVDQPLVDLLRVRVEVSWTDEGAADTTTDTRLKHSIVLESIRTRQDLL